MFDFANFGGLKFLTYICKSGVKNKHAAKFGDDRPSNPGD